MNDAKHTPGPWEIDGPDEFADFDIRSTALSGTVACVGIVESHVDRPRAETEANARLIAAAPELLDALRLGLAYAEKVAGTCPTQPTGKLRQMQARKDAEAIRAAIAKATGKAA